MLVGVIAGIADGIAYHFHVREHGVDFFSRVPWNVLWSYVKTFPGNILTCLWLLPWIIALLYLYITNKIDDMKFKRKIEEEFLKAKHKGGRLRR